LVASRRHATTCRSKARLDKQGKYSFEDSPATKLTFGSGSFRFLLFGIGARSACPSCDRFSFLFSSSAAAGLLSRCLSALSDLTPPRFPRPCGFRLSGADFVATVRCSLFLARFCSRIPSPAGSCALRRFLGVSLDFGLTRIPSYLVSFELRITVRFLGVPSPLCPTIV
jgi:hypothetical protein